MKMKRKLEANLSLNFLLMILFPSVYVLWSFFKIELKHAILVCWTSVLLVVWKHTSKSNPLPATAGYLLVKLSCMFGWFFRQYVSIWKMVTVVDNQLISSVWHRHMTVFCRVLGAWDITSNCLLAAVTRDEESCHIGIKGIFISIIGQEMNIWLNSLVKCSCGVPGIFPGFFILCQLNVSAAMVNQHDVWSKSVEMDKGGK